MGKLIQFRRSPNTLLATLKVQNQPAVPYREFILIGYEYNGGTLAIQCDTKQMLDAIESLMEEFMEEVQKVPKTERAELLGHFQELIQYTSRNISKEKWV